MTTTKNEVEIKADPQVPTIEITREFDAAPEQVFRAHVDPELYARWVGPHALTTRVLKWDARTGGEWAFANDQDGREVASFYGSFHEIRANERIVWTFTFEGMPDGVSLETVTFEELPDGRTRLRVLSVVESFEIRDAILASGMDSGVREGYESLDALLAG
ncbi:polyketide cyclase [Saccharomonospora sp. CUA-673]|uniref:SRPBCC family protein n=1 Tax=Saccharomonospora sp. CUA-673 TaxID=1904969 RepID=UPI000960241E|nr:SRPBCC family protein [Saccharomonospora sp. CUA-673]OLT45233.1 polyketide cyclase [Saccharomonospora sp. CUA-673]